MMLTTQKTQCVRIITHGAGGGIRAATLQLWDCTGEGMAEAWAIETWVCMCGSNPWVREEEEQCRRRHVCACLCACECWCVHALGHFMRGGNVASHFSFLFCLIGHENEAMPSYVCGHQDLHGFAAVAVFLDEAAGDYAPVGLCHRRSQRESSTHA